MSGIDDPGTPPEIPEEYADVYRDAYLRALAEQEAADAAAAAQAAAEPADLPVIFVEDEPDDTTHWSSGVWMAILAVAVVLLIAAAFGLGKLLSDDDVPATTGAKTPGASASARTSPAGQQGSPTPSTSRAPSQSPVAGAWEGAVTPVVIGSATATCTARPGVDSAGQPVTYDVTNSYDDDPTTAWRCDSDGIGQQLTFTVPDGTEIGELGLIPGYAKDDPVSGTDRYAENNRITRVRWTLSDGVQVVQRLKPDPRDRQLQTIRIPRTATTSITLEILAVKRGPRNTTAISTVALGAAT